MAFADIQTQCSLLHQTTHLLCSAASLSYNQHLLQTQVSNYYFEHLLQLNLVYRGQVLDKKLQQIAICLNDDVGICVQSFAISEGNFACQELFFAMKLFKALLLTFNRGSFFLIYPKDYSDLALHSWAV